MQIKHSKWLCRCLLVLLFSGMFYITLLPGYNFAHFVPHPLLRTLGVPYEYMLGFENHMDKLLHFGGAFCLLFLLYGAKLSSSHSFYFQLFSYFFLILCMVFGAEIVQHYRGRGFDSTDLLLGILGAISALLIVFAAKRPK